MVHNRCLCVGASSLTGLSSEGHGHVLNVDKQLAMNGATSVFIVKRRYLSANLATKRKVCFWGNGPFNFMPFCSLLVSMYEREKHNLHGNLDGLNPKSLKGEMHVGTLSCSWALQCCGLLYPR
jgi:hypothetical protein